MTKPRSRDAARHPIGVVTERTGLSTHVLRAWERRYGVVRPVRGDGGQRLYSDADVERLALLHRARRAGRTVGVMVALSAAELRRVVVEDAERASTRPTLPASYRDQAMESVRALQPARLESQLRRALLSVGALTFLEDVAAPLLEEIGRDWHDGRITIAQEHAASGAVLQLLGWMIRALEVPDAAPRVVVATPRGEHHAFGAMMAAAIASHDGWQVTWLGADLPAAQVATAVEQRGVRAVALSVVTHRAGLKRELRSLQALLPPHVPLLVGGAGATRLANVPGVARVRDFRHWRALLRAHAAKPQGQ